MIENNKPIENQNDFNPNMPGYVETFEEETETDLMAVRRERIKLLAAIQYFRITANDAKTYNTKHYGLRAIIAVGYKVNSERAVQFRKWATGIIQEFTIKGFSMDDERLKNDGSILGKKYFEEQLQRLVSAYLDIAEDMALRQISMTMQDWEVRLNRYIDATDRDILNDAGKVTAEIAKEHPLTEFEKSRVIQG